MKKAQLNIFTKGIVSDLDTMHIGPDQWVFPTTNYRVMNKKGQGLIMTTLPSNSVEPSQIYPEGAEFLISDGFIALGAAEYKGIAYIVSHNPQTSESEVGVFPSYDNTTGGFVRAYSPLLNYTTHPLNYFRTPKFKYSLERMVDVFTKESYDTSVDIYLCDGENLNKVINSGFRADGTSNGRTYTQGDFHSVLNQIASTDKVMKAELMGIENGGVVKYGNYYHYFRLVTEDFTRTPFVGSMGWCQSFK